MSRAIARVGLATVLAAGLCVAIVSCDRKANPTDAQLASAVHGKLSRDAMVANLEIAVQAQQGVVTLNGNVTSEAERAVAASDAATVEGVRTVVNNLVVQEAAGSTHGPASIEAQKKAASKAMAAARPTKQSADNLPPAGATVPAQAPAQQAAVTPPPSPAPPPPPKKVTIPAGTPIHVRLSEGLDSERNHAGDTFHGTLTTPIMIDDQTAIPSGADVTGRVVDAKSAGRFGGNSALKLELNSLSVNGRTYDIQTNQWSRQGKGEGKDAAVKAGSRAAIGAIIAGLSGGGKGGAIGTVSDAGAAGAAGAKKGEQIRLEPEATLNFLLVNGVTVTQPSVDKHYASMAPMP